MLSKLDCFFFYFLLYIVQYVDNQLVICICRCRMFICPRKRYLCCIKHCISICKFLKNIFGGQTGDKISHTKRKKNNKTTSQKNVLNCKRHGLSLAIILLCLSLSLGCRVRFCIISETPKAIVLHTKRKKQ